MKKNLMKAAAACGLCVTLLASGISASAAYSNRAAQLSGQTVLGQSRMQTASDGESGQQMGRMVISEPGNYTLTGNMRGMVYVDPGKGNVRLTLDGAQLNGSNGPAIMAVSGDRLDIQLANSSMNSIYGGPNSNFGAAVYSEIPVFLDGGGRLDMMSQGQDAFRVNGGDLTFNSGDVRIRADGNGFNARNVNFNGGTVSLDAQRNDFAPGANTNQNGAAQSSTDTAGTVVAGTTENSAMGLTADYDNAATYDVSENSTVKITESGTYVVTGSSDDGSITVKKGTTGVVLVLDDLDLTSTSGATLSINKNAEVQVIVSGTVNLTDNENPDDEYSTDADVADAYDGAAIKVKAESVVFITGDGTLNVNGSAKNGIKGGDDSSIIIGGKDLTVNINASNDGINGSYDVTILGGTVNVSAGDDGIHADHILTIGDEATHTGPTLTVRNSTEGLEGTVVNIAGGKINVTASDDGINAANGDGAYEGELGYSVNITGGDVTVNAKTDGIDSNGNVNLIGGSATIKSANNGGDAGIDYDGDYYVSGSFRLNNQSGVTGPDNMMGGQMGGFGGQAGGFGGQMGGFGGQTGGFGGQTGGFGGPMGR